MRSGPDAGGTERVRALDGVRAVAILVVVAYHSGVAGFANGGFYGQDIFFVLSGYLITSLLLAEWRTRRGIALVRFWIRRVRRLIPALLLMLAAVTVYVVTVASAGRYPGYRADALSSVFYFANWHFIAASSNYFVASGYPSLLTHTWSLSVEEQFYIVWPVVLAGLFGLTKAGARAAARITLVISSSGALAAAAWMAYLAHEGVSRSRLYFGTDTHCQTLLVGAAAASLAALHSPRDGHSTLSIPIQSAAVRRLADVAGVISLGLLLVVVTRVSSDSTFAFEGGFLCVGVLGAALVAATVVTPRLGVARVLEAGPLVFVGRISYGMYLWFMPLFAVVDYSSTGLRDLDLFGVRLAADIGVATVSYLALERPAQRTPILVAGGPRWWGRARPLGVGFAGMGLAAVLIVAVTPPGGPPSTQPPSPAASEGTPGGASAASAGAMRILVVGDSTGATLALALASVPGVDRRYGVSVETATLFGCGVVVSAMVDEHGVAASPPPACNSSTPADQLWPALMQRAVETDHPAVVLVVAGRWEVMNRQPRPGAPWTDILQPADQAYVESQLIEAVEVGSSAGAHVYLATTPCFSSGEQPDGNGWPEDQYSRVVAYNRLLAQAADSDGGAASVVDLGQLVCPGGKFRSQIDGVVVRSSDGVHYPFYNLGHPDGYDPESLQQVETFGQWIGSRLLPLLVK